MDVANNFKDDGIHLSRLKFQNMFFKNYTWGFIQIPNEFLSH